MATDGRSIVVIDTSVLVNFLAVDRVDLLANHPLYRFVVTDHVRGEVTDAYPDQLARLDIALDALQLEQVSVTDIDELQAFATLASDGRLGAGECAAIATASVRALIVAIDDKAARKRAAVFDSAIQLSSTVDLMVSLIKAGALNVASADAIKLEWEAKHRFTLKFASFSDVIGS
jgi:predicted nucleic acid-binding protein